MTRKSDAERQQAVRNRREREGLVMVRLPQFARWMKPAEAKVIKGFILQLIEDRRNK